jgi:hypothetical protein
VAVPCEIGSKATPIVFPLRVALAVLLKQVLPLLNHPYGYGSPTLAFERPQAFWASAL